MYRFQTVILLFIVGLGIGILFAVQFKSQNRIDNPVVSSVALRDAKIELELEREDLNTQVKSIRKEIDSRQGDLKKDKRISQDLVREAEQLRQAAGLTEQKARGLVITLADSEKGEATVDSIVHAADLRDVINTLWKGGAEAISVNDQRVVISTSIDSIVNTILINNTKIANPFVIKAIGDLNKMNRELETSSNMADIRKRLKSEGLIYNVAQTKEVTIAAFSGGLNFSIAKSRGE